MARYALLTLFFLLTAPSWAQTVALDASVRGRVASVEILESPRTLMVTLYHRDSPEGEWETRERRVARAGDRLVFHLTDTALGGQFLVEATDGQQVWSKLMVEPVGAVPKP